MTEWLVRQAGSEPIGPVSTELVLRGIRAGRVVPTAEVCRVGDSRWLPISQVRELSGGDFEDDETNVTDSPWFLQHTTEPLQARPPPPSAARPPPLGLSPPSQRPSQPWASRPQPPSLPGAGPQSSTLVAGQRPYDDVDDEAATRVAGSPLDDDFVETREAQVDDETMTRVARPQLSSPELPASRRPTSPPEKNVLPTMPMSVVVPQPSGPPQQEMLPPTQSFGPNPHLPPVVAPLGSFPPVSGAPGAPGAEPQGYYPPPEPQQQNPYWAPQPADETHGLKALFALIVFLAVALAIVILLLIIRR